MSLSSPKQKYVQLSDWLATFKKKSDTKGTAKKDSRSDYYKKKGFK